MIAVFVVVEHKARKVLLSCERQPGELNPNPTLVVVMLCPSAVVKDTLYQVLLFCVEV